MRYTKLLGMWIALGMYLGLGYVAVSTAADLAPTSAFVQAGIGDQH